MDGAGEASESGSEIYVSNYILAARRATIRRCSFSAIRSSRRDDLCEFSTVTVRFVRRCGRGGDIRGWSRVRRAFTRPQFRHRATLQGGIFKFERRLAGLHRDRKPAAQHRLVHRGRTSGERRTGRTESAQEWHVGPFAVSGRRLPAGRAQRGLQMRREQFRRKSAQPRRAGQSR